MFNIASDSFLTDQDILERISQEEVFKIVFGEIPRLDIKYTSPFRKDNNPDCYFEYYNDVLIFIDFAGGITENGLSLTHVNCFNAIMIYYNLTHFQALKFIGDYIKNNDIKFRPSVIPYKIIKNQVHKTRIFFKPRNWKKRDFKFWNQFEIDLRSLQKDFVYPIEEVFLVSSKKGKYFRYRTSPFTYAYTDFKNGEVQIYQPFANKKGQKKFIMSCTRNSIFGLNTFKKDCEYCFISKSYKDWKTLSLCDLNACGFINEGMLPDKKVLLELFKNIKNIIIFFDNDEAGKSASERVKIALSELFPNKKIHKIFLKDPKLKDPSDFVKYNSIKELKNKLDDFKRKYLNY